MASERESVTSHEEPEKPSRPSMRQTAVDYSRGVAGGLLVGMPLLMTMEMWWSGFYMPPLRLLSFLVLHFAILLILEYYSGFRETRSVREEAADALAAVGIGLVISAVILFMLNILNTDMSLQEISGKIIIQSVPVSIGVSLATSEFGQSNRRGEERKRHSSFWGTLGIALAGATVFGFNIAPTEEPLVLAVGMQWWHALMVLALSMIQVHAIVYALNFRGSGEIPPGASWRHIFVRATVPSYAIALVVATYLLWIFGRVDFQTGLMPALHMIVTLGFVTSLGAAVGRLIL